VGVVFQLRQAAGNLEQHHWQRTRSTGLDGGLPQSPVQVCHHGDQPSTFMYPPTSSGQPLGQSRSRLSRRRLDCLGQYQSFALHINNLTVEVQRRRTQLAFPIQIVRP
jgi:hypothetical protein